MGADAAAYAEVDVSTRHFASLIYQQLLIALRIRDGGLPSPCLRSILKLQRAHRAALHA